MIRVIIRIDTDQIVGKGECHLEVELSTDKIIVEGCNTSTIIEMTWGQEILEEHKIVEVKILEVDIEVIKEMTTLAKAEVDLERDNIQVI